MKTTIKMEYEQRCKAFSVDKKGTKFDLLTDIKIFTKQQNFGWLVVLRFNTTLTAKIKFWTGQTAFTEYMGECNTILSAYTLYRH